MSNIAKSGVTQFLGKRLDGGIFRRENAALWGTNALNLRETSNMVTKSSRQLSSPQLGPNFSCTFNSSEYALTKVTKANKLVGLFYRTLKVKESEPYVFRTHYGVLISGWFVQVAV